MIDIKKLMEVQKILGTKTNIDTDSKIKELKHTYKKDLKGFKYVVDPQLFFGMKNKYIKYVGFNNQLYYGGFFLKAENKCDSIFIYMINKDKKVWSIDFNKNYIFVNDKITEDDKIRDIFEQYLKDNQN
jgi:hypothetical protein